MCRIDRGWTIGPDATGAVDTGAYDGAMNESNPPMSALPSSVARVLAFVSILVGGLAGAVIGFALVDVQCTGDCDLMLGVGIIAGAVVSAGGTAVVAVLGLRALGEWREMSDRS